ncbi:hypothetical protein [Desulfosediminicola ganghwensis]|uniref:hypothetical protein n=1 Tax=Desulfosediminicola ganghwensis TaxID=2569540 RepID=UPI0010AC47F0|nr:hypothetical protein [Desulfosediminicola ganghwensis]
MRILDTGGIKELMLGSFVAAVCFGAPALMKYTFPDPTAIHEVVNEMPFLGCLIVGLTFLRLLQRKKNLEKDAENN